MGQCQLFKGIDFHVNEFGLSPVGSREQRFFNREVTGSDLHLRNMTLAVKLSVDRSREG